MAEKQRKTMRFSQCHVHFSQCRINSTRGAYAHARAPAYALTMAFANGKGQSQGIVPPSRGPGAPKHLGIPLLVAYTATNYVTIGSTTYCHLLKCDVITPSLTL